MIKIHILGSCSGTEPMPNRHHTSFVIEWNDRLYFFDAGENCAYTSHLMGLDLMRTRKIVISHPHMDHIGGLGNLIWTIRKLDGMHHTLKNREIELCIPEIRVWDGIYQTLRYNDGGFKADFVVNAHEFEDGLLFEDDGIRVSALHTHHLSHEDGTPWRSFGFLIEVDGKRIVYTGDTKGIDDYEAFLPCDLLLTETGHHHPTDVAQILIDRKQVPPLLAFIHHGRDILNHCEEQTAALDKLLGEQVKVCNDRDTIIL